MQFTWAEALPLFFMAVMGLALLAYVIRRITNPW